MKSKLFTVEQNHTLISTSFTVTLACDIHKAKSTHRTFMQTVHGVSALLGTAVKIAIAMCINIAPLVITVSLSMGSVS